MPASSPIGHGSIRSAGLTGNTVLADPEQVYGPVVGNGRVSDNFLLGADPVRDNGPAVAGRARGNFLLVADPVQDSGRRAAGPGQRSVLPTGEAD